MYSDRFGSWLRAMPVWGGSHRWQREVVDSDDDREGGHSHGGHDTHDGHPLHGGSEEFVARNEDVVVVESILMARNLEPLRGKSAVNEVFDMGDSSFVGDTDIPEED